MDNWKKDIFFENEEMPEADIKMFNEVLGMEISEDERFFFEQMRAKETREFAPSADLLLSEDDNEERLFLVRYYFTEYKVGKVGVCLEWPIYCDTLSDMLRQDIYPLLSRHITLIDWLREQNFACVKYNGNYALK